MKNIILVLAVILLTGCSEDATEHVEPVGIVYQVDSIMESYGDAVVSYANGNRQESIVLDTQKFLWLITELELTEQDSKDYPKAKLLLTVFNNECQDIPSVIKVNHCLIQIDKVFGYLMQSNKGVN